MVLVSNPLGGEYYMDGRLNLEMEKVSKAVMVKDKDRFFVVDGSEGSGKSVFAFQLAARLDKNFSLDKIAFTPESFKKAIHKAKKGEAVVFDEAFTGLSSRASLSRINNLLVSLMMEMRQKNLFVFIVLPTIFLLDKYVALWRSVGLFHIYTKNGRRGFFIYFNKSKKKLLYLYGRKDYTYSSKFIPRSGFRGRFLDQYTISEDDYRLKKRTALEDKSFSSYVSDGLVDRDKLLLCLKEELNLTLKDLSVLIEKYGVELAVNSISVAINRIRKDSKV